MTPIKRIFFALYAFLFTRHRVSLRDIGDFRHVASAKPTGVSLTISGSLDESSKTITKVNAVLRGNTIEISVVARGIVVSGPHNRGTLQETFDIVLPQPGRYEFAFVNRNGAKQVVGSYTRP